MPEYPPLTDEYLKQCEYDARKFSGCWDQGTSGVLAAHVMRLLRDRQRLYVELAMMKEKSSGATG